MALASNPSHVDIYRDAVKVASIAWKDIVSVNFHKKGYYFDLIIPDSDFMA